MKPEYEPMTMQELGDVIKYALRHNNPFTAGNGNRRVKYIDPVIDLRDGKCFSVVFRTYSGDFRFNSSTGDLYDECMMFLHGITYSLPNSENSVQYNLFTN